MDKVNEIFEYVYVLQEGEGTKEEIITKARQSLYKLLVDEMPKEKNLVKESQKDGRSHFILAKGYNQARTDCLAVIKRVLIGGE